MKKVSVIIPTYKRSLYICRAINSVLEQTYKNIEIIIVDDNGINSKYREETKKKLENYIYKRKIVYIENEKNLGGAEARNVGILNATGDYITFLDDDDVYMSEKVEKQVEQIEKYNIDLSIVDDANYSQDDKFMSRTMHPIHGICTDQEELLKAHLIYHIVGTNDFMFKSEKLREINGFDNVPAGHEFVLIYKAILHNMKIGRIDDELVKYYIHNNERISTSKNKLVAEEIIYNIKKKHFSLFTNSEIRYINSKHHGVVFYVRYSNGEYFKAFVSLIRSFFYSPSSFISIAKTRWKNLLYRKK